MFSVGQPQFDRPVNSAKNIMKSALHFVVFLLVVILTGCAGEKNRPVAQRGWIGGDYALAKPSSFLVAMSGSPGVVGTLPKSLQHTQKAAIMVTQLTTNTPAEMAGLSAGDFILEINHQPVTRLQAFRRQIDRSPPGT
jgi:S1-C subfamily serine protease